MASDAASSSDRPSKLRKLEQFRRQLPHVSLSALQSILDLAQKEGVPELHSRKMLSKLWSRTSDLSTTMGRYRMKWSARG